MSWQRRSDPRAKSMGSYELFAWRDACDVASLLGELYDVATARELFANANDETLRDFEEKNSSLLEPTLLKSHNRDARRFSERSTRIRMTRQQCSFLCSQSSVFCACVTLSTCVTAFVFHSLQALAIA